MYNETTPSLPSPVAGLSLTGGCCPCSPYRFAGSVRPCEINTYFPFLRVGSPLYPLSYPLISPFLLPFETPYLGPVACGCYAQPNPYNNLTSPWC